MSRENPAPSSVADASTAPAEPARGLGLAALGVAILASACCWLPLLLVGLGLGGGAVSARFEAWRPVTLPLTFLLLGVAWFLALRARRRAASPAAACCAATGGRSRSRLGLLSVVTALALGFAFFPELETAWLGGARDAAAVDGQGPRVRIVVRGMTCEGCAASIAEALRATPGVAAADVSYEEGRALVRLERGADAAALEAELLAAVRRAGYEGEIVAGGAER